MTEQDLRSAGFAVEGRDSNSQNDAVASTSPDTTPIAAKFEAGKRKQLRALTGLRIIAASMIVLFHSADTFAIDNHHVIAKYALVQGVSLFFVLSGFILTYTYPNLSSAKDSLKFVMLRLARVWPVHAATALFAVFFLSSKWIGHEYILAPNFLLLQDWIPIQRFFFSLNAVSWSVSAELFFYCCFPFISGPIKRKPWLSVSISFAVAMACIFASRYFPESANHMDDVTSFGLVTINPLVRVFEFVIGIATARLYFRYRDTLSQVGQKQFAAIELLSAAFIVFVVFGVKQLFSAQTIDAIMPHLASWVDTSGGVLAYAVLILVLALEKGYTFKLLSTKAFVWLGEISYSVYLVHWLWIKVFVNLHFTELHLPRAGAYALYWCCVLASSAILYTFLEKPARSYLGKKIHAV